ncbi:hypothetical protein GQ457_18G011630 [Hibiscus cannabinus]
MKATGTARASFWWRWIAENLDGAVAKVVEPKSSRSFTMIYVVYSRIDSEKEGEESEGYLLVVTLTGKDRRSSGRRWRVRQLGLLLREPSDLREGGKG